jgi:aldose 1-epimerase
VPPVTLQNDRLELEVWPEVGASIIRFATLLDGRWVPVLRETPPSALQERRSSPLACFVLVPYSNRIRDARFRFGGETYQLRAAHADGHAIHGDARDRPWELVDASPTSVALRFESARFTDINFPFPFAASVGYELDGATLRAELEVRNAGDMPMPAGMGFHPYYRRALTVPEEQVELQAGVRSAFTELAPTTAAVPISAVQDFGRLRPLGDAEHDTCFAGWDGRATIVWPKARVRAEVTCEPPLRHLVLYTPPGQPFFALEPVSNANNGFNLLADGVPDSGVRILEPGQTMAASFRLRIVA